MNDDIKEANFSGVFPGYPSPRPDTAGNIHGPSSRPEKSNIKALIN